MPALRYDPNQGFVAETKPPAAGEFPVPFAVSGTAPKLDPALMPAASPPKPNGPLAGPMPNRPTLPRGLPADDPAAGPPSKKPAKPVKIDPELLEKALLNRNADR